MGRFGAPRALLLISPIVTSSNTICRACAPRVIRNIGGLYAVTSIVAPGIARLTILANRGRVRPTTGVLLSINVGTIVMANTMRNNEIYGCIFAGRGDRGVASRFVRGSTRNNDFSNANSVFTSFILNELLYNASIFTTISRTTSFVNGTVGADSVGGEGSNVSFRPCLGAVWKRLGCRGAGHWGGCFRYTFYHSCHNCSHVCGGTRKCWQKLFTFQQFGSLSYELLTQPLNYTYYNGQQHTYKCSYQHDHLNAHRNGRGNARHNTLCHYGPLLFWGWKRTGGHRLMRHTSNGHFKPCRSFQLSTYEKSCMFFPLNVSFNTLRRRSNDKRHGHFRGFKLHFKYNWGPGACRVGKSIWL